MTTLLLTFLFLAAVMLAMSVGVIMGRKPITGSCGGVGAALGEQDYQCEICGGDPKHCEARTTPVLAKSLAYDAAAGEVRNDG